MGFLDSLKNMFGTAKPVTPNTDMRMKEDHDHGCDCEGGCDCDHHKSGHECCGGESEHCCCVHQDMAENTVDANPAAEIPTDQTA